MAKWQIPTLLFSLVLALGVITLGSYVRLSDAGLGCPDWPGCYGHLIGVPDSHGEISNANSNFERPVETAKAWKEVIHRYLAGTLGLVILFIALMSLRRKEEASGLPLLLVGVVVFQAVLGMWTVTLQLKPLVVVGHLLGGFTVFAILGWLYMRSAVQKVTWFAEAPRLSFMALLVLGVLLVQIFLGGWTSSNYAALACADFPRCQSAWWPQMNFSDAFVLWRGLGINYEYGVLEHPARTAIHMSHRIGALITFLVIGYFGSKLLKAHFPPLVRFLGKAMLTLLVIQVLLGISNIVFHLPLGVAVAHNGVAALLMLSLVMTRYVLRCAALNGRS